MRIWHVVGLFLFVAIVIGLILSNSRSVETLPNLEAIQGLWKVVYTEIDGVQLEVEAFDEYLVFSNERLVWYRFEEGLQYEWLNRKIRLDPTQNPKHFDLFVEQDGKQEIRTNIYEIVNGELILLLDPSYESYPSEFVTHNGDGRTLIKLRRIGPLPALRHHETT